MRYFIGKTKNLEDFVQKLSQIDICPINIKFFNDYNFYLEFHLKYL
ncbi:hypothetical protein BH23BAC1_BH23BAC1_16690 [soil metagenome]